MTIAERELAIAATELLLERLMQPPAPAAEQTFDTSDSEDEIRGSERAIVAERLRIKMTDLGFSKAVIETIIVSCT